MSQTITQAVYALTPILNVLWMKKFYREQGWTLRRSGAILMKSFTIWHQKIVSCWQNAIAFRRRLMSGIAAIRGR